MTAFAAKVLAEGQLPSSKGTLYTVPGATKGYVRQMRIFSTGAAQTIIIYLKPGSTSRKQIQFVLSTNESADVFSETIELEAGDLIEGETTDAATVDYVITGVEEA